MAGLKEPCPGGPVSQGNLDISASSAKDSPLPPAVEIANAAALAGIFFVVVVVGTKMFPDCTYF